MNNITYSNQPVNVMRSYNPVYSKEGAIKSVSYVKSGHVQAVQMAPLAILEDWVKGYTFIPAEMREGAHMTEENWISQQLFLVDIDHHLEPHEALLMSEDAGIHPLFMYSSFSDSAQERHFRIGYLLDTKITSIPRHKWVCRALISLFNQEEECADPRIHDAGRVFFGGKEILYKDESAIVSLDKLEQVLPFQAEAYKESKARSVKPATYRPVNNERLAEHLAYIKHHDALGLRRCIGSELQNAGNPCGSKAEGTSSLHTTITVNDITYSYCGDLGQHPVSPVISRDSADLASTTSHLPLNLLLGVEFHQLFSCVLPGHEDHHPSASVNQLEDGRIVYNCFSCIDPGKYIDAIEVIQRLTGYGYARALRFIEQALNIELKTAWQKEVLTNLGLETDYLKSDLFRMQYPVLYKGLNGSSKRLGLLLYVLDEARSYMYGESLTGDDRPTFFLSIRQMCKRMAQLSYAQHSFYSVRKKLEELVHLGLLIRLQDKELPSKLLGETQKHAKANHYDYHITFYCIPEYGYDVFTRATEILIHDQEVGYTQSSSTHVGLINLYGQEHASSVHPQDSKRPASKEAQSFQKAFYKFADAFLTEYGYLTKQLCMEKMRGYKTSIKKALIPQVLPAYVSSHHLHCVRLNKAYRQQLDIPLSIKSGSTLIVPITE